MLRAYQITLFHRTMPRFLSENQLLPTRNSHGYFAKEKLVCSRKYRRACRIWGYLIGSKKVVLGGGCFWGLQDLMRKQNGVVKTTAGYAGGMLPVKTENPTYEDHEGYTEAVEIEYDTEKTSYKKLLDFFFQIHNPTTLNQQGNDRGTSYRSVIFYTNDEEKKDAFDFIDIVNNSKRWKNPVVTAVEPLKKFYKAEEYHQDFLQKNPGGYTCHAIWFDSYLK